MTPALDFDLDPSDVRQSLAHTLSRSSLDSSCTSTLYAETSYTVQSCLSDSTIFTPLAMETLPSCRRTFSAPSSSSLRPSDTKATDDGDLYTATTRSSTHAISRPRTLVGDMFAALSEATMPLIESMRIRRKLSAINSDIRRYEKSIHHPMDPEGEGTLRLLDDMMSSQTISPPGPTTNLDHIYADLMELSRHHQYNTEARQRALRLFIYPVRFGETRRLIELISNLPPVEAMQCVYDLMSVPLSSSSPGSLVSLLLYGQGTLSYRYLIFVCRLARLNSSMYQLLLDFGFLNMILRVCIGPNDEWASRAFANVLAFCNTTLRALCVSHQEREEAISNHPLCALWPSNLPFFLRTLPISGPKPHLYRQQAWRIVDERNIRHRLATVQWEFSRGESDSEPIFELAWIDLLEFSRPHFKYGDDIVRNASRLLAEFQAKGEKFQQAYRYCRESSEDERDLLQVIPYVP